MVGLALVSAGAAAAYAVVRARAGSPLGAAGVAVLVALAAVVAALIARRAPVAPRARGRSRHEGWVARTPRRSQAIGSPLPRDPMGAFPLNGRASNAIDDADGAVVSSFLRTLADSCGATDVVYWRWSAETEDLMAAACVNRRNLADTPRETEPQGGAVVGRDPSVLAKWAAEQGVVHFDDRAVGDTVTLAAAPVAAPDRAFGALTLRAPNGLRLTRAELKDRLPRWSAHLAQLTTLIDQHDLIAERHERIRALLSAAQSLPTARDVTELGEALCHATLASSTASSCVLVRWFTDDERGVVEAVSDGHPLPKGASVTADSRVARQCLAGSPQLWPDARAVVAEEVLYGPWVAKQRIGSLAIVPMTRSGRVIAALVAEADEPGLLTQDDLRALSLLGSIAGSTLETLWEMEEVSRRARTDQLTGLANRRAFDEQFRTMLAQTDRFGGTLSMVVADIDHFKRVNDGHGHDAGDSVLRTIAKVFREGTREVDICARYGGEEIAVLLPQTSLAGAHELAERLRRAVEGRVIHVPGGELSVTASFGVATYPEPVKHADSLFGAADRALYRAKGSGRNRVICHGANERHGAT
jgi:diguanylate cyclase (GGDEF)-like protein